MKCQNELLNSVFIIIFCFLDGFYTTYCPTRHIHSSTPTTGFILSPNHPNEYSAPLDCVFNITTSPSNVIQLAFVSFDLAEKSQMSQQCLDAYLLVVVVDRHGRHHVGQRMCGKEIPQPINTMQSWLQIQFVSTTSQMLNRGFRIQYRILSESAIQEPLSFNSEPTIKECGGHSSPGQLSGEIVSPGYPLTYPKNATCNWLIRVESRQRIYIRIVHLNLAPTIAECDIASLTIMDGYKHELSNERKDSNEIWEARFCGSQSYYTEEGMKSYLSSANRILVRLVTHDRPPKLMHGKDRIGFKIVWTAVEGLVGENPTSIDDKSKIDDDSQTCKGQFTCDGGQVCVEQGHGICASRSRLCIHNSLVCDGVHNCVEGDFSDEQHCYSKEIITSAACGFTLIVITMLIFVCCDQMRKRKRLRELIEERRTTSNGKCSNSNNRNVRLPPNR